MTDLNEMWEALAQYQPYADKRGFGDEWRRMTTKRTVSAAVVALDAADAGWAKYSAAYALAAAEDASVECGQFAIENIREAIEQEQT